MTRLVAPTRSSGILLHVTSLPSPFGIGDLGPAAYRWVEQLARAKQRWWQVLPFNPPDASNSPYSALSAFAGNPVLVSPEQLVRDGYLEPTDIPRATFPTGRAAFDRVRLFKHDLLTTAWRRFTKRPATRRAAFRRYRQTQGYWLDDFALFVALREMHPGVPWRAWPADLLRRDASALQAARRQLAEVIDRCAFAQFLFDEQLIALRRFAAEHDVRIIGDVPIYVSGDSADVWANPMLFQLDRHLRPRRVAGCPPDLFSADGQRWGNPLFDWQVMRRDGYAWWVRRIQRCLEHADLVRIDHFRGLAGYWSIPASEPTARHGKWVNGPGARLLDAIHAAVGGLPVIAEDLGEITPDVYALRDRFALPGMTVLHFAFGGDDSPYLPHNHHRRSVVYTGTHDNDTTAGWFRSLPPQERRNVVRYAPDAERDPAAALMRLAWSSVAELAIAPAQDVLRLGAEARMNIPGVGQGNWGWRLPSRGVSDRAMNELRTLTETFRRTAADPRTT